MSISNHTCSNNIELSIENYLNEDIFFKVSNKWYKGKVPAFYDSTKLPFTTLLESNFQIIREEILSLYSSNSEEFKSMYVPSKYEESKWVVYNFYGFLLKYPENLSKVPRLAKILNQIPNLVTAQISILKPNTRIKAHISGSNALIRSHLPIVLPGEYPQIGFRVKQEERGWKEGELLSFSESNRHYSWNYSDTARIVLLIDTIHPSYADKKNYICANSLSVLVLKMIASKFPFTKSFPEPIINLFLKIFAIPFYILFFLQNNLDIYIFSWLQKMKFK